MTVSELRIGNWVIGINGEHFQVSKVTIGNLDPDMLDDLLLKPIQLTKEWLVRFGFEYDSYGNLTKGQLSIEKHLNGGWLRILDGTWSDGIKIEHVHQLQNLYFALTGEELELKP